VEDILPVRPSHEVMENLRALEHAPGVAMQEVPPDSMIPEFDEDDLNPDERCVAL